jgi:hypothetical protein
MTGPPILFSLQGGRPVTFDVWAMTRRRLAERYGPDEAALKIRAFDQASQDDLARWRALGGSR